MTNAAAGGGSRVLTGAAAAAAARGRKPGPGTAAPGPVPAPGATALETTGSFGYALVMFYLFIEYFRPQYYVTPLNYARLGLIACFAGVIYLFFQRKRPIPTVGWLMLLFIALLFKTVPFAPSGPKALMVTTTMLTMTLAGPMVIMTALDSVQRLRRATFFFVILGTLLALQGIKSNGHGAGGIFEDENDLAMGLCTVIPLAWFFATGARVLWERILALATFALCVLGVVVSFSRGGFLALVAVLAYMITRSKRRVAAVLVIAIAIALVIPFIPSGWVKEMQSIGSADQKGDTGENRLYMWGVAWRVFLDHPVMGVGAMNYPLIAPLYEDPLRRGSEMHLWGRACHSVYFTLFAESGVPGSLVWIAISLMTMLSLHRVGLRLDERLARAPADSPAADRARQLTFIARGIEGGMIGFLAAGAFITVNYYPSWWTLVAMAAAAELTLRCDPVLAEG